jgi:hypothetical protein
MTIVSDATIWSVTYDRNWWHQLRLELSRIVNYDRNCSFIVLASHYDRKLQSQNIYSTGNWKQQCFFWVFTFPGLFFLIYFHPFSHNLTSTFYHLSSFHAALSTPLMISSTMELTSLQRAQKEVLKVILSKPRGTCTRSGNGVRSIVNG